MAETSFSFFVCQNKKGVFCAIYCSWKCLLLLNKLPTLLASSSHHITPLPPSHHQQILHQYQRSPSKSLPSPPLTPLSSQSYQYSTIISITEPLTSQWQPILSSVPPLIPPSLSQTGWPWPWQWASSTSSPLPPLLSQLGWPWHHHNSTVCLHHHCDFSYFLACRQ